VKGLLARRGKNWKILLREESDVRNTSRKRVVKGSEKGHYVGQLNQ
jgi:hypothetical protein